MPKRSCFCTAPEQVPNGAGGRVAVRDAVVAAAGAAAAAAAKPCLFFVECAQRRLTRSTLTMLPFAPEPAAGSATCSRASSSRSSAGVFALMSLLVRWQAGAAASGMMAGAPSAPGAGASAGAAGAAAVGGVISAPGSRSSFSGGGADGGTGGWPFHRRENEPRSGCSRRDLAAQTPAAPTRRRLARRSLCAPPLPWLWRPPPRRPPCRPARAAQPRRRSAGSRRVGGARTRAAQASTAHRGPTVWGVVSGGRTCRVSCPLSSCAQGGREVRRGARAAKPSPPPSPTVP
mmetsp:Transcript_37476/g.124151  ORF Transcript_37476/g.124151 Transcript_37476/m.124151 type:complete len:289 (-) Transcript_37476:216-1082(-)